MLESVLQWWPTIPPMPFMLQGAVHTVVGIFFGVVTILAGVLAMIDGRSWMHRARSLRGKMRFGVVPYQRGRILSVAGVVMLFLGSYVIAVFAVLLVTSMISALLQIAHANRHSRD